MMPICPQREQKRTLFITYFPAISLVFLVTPYKMKARCADPSGARQWHHSPHTPRTPRCRYFTTESINEVYSPWAFQHANARGREVNYPFKNESEVRRPYWCPAVTSHPLPPEPRDTDIPLNWVEMSSTRTKLSSALTLRGSEGNWLIKTKIRCTDPTRKTGTWPWRHFRFPVVRFDTGISRKRDETS